MASKGGILLENSKEDRKVIEALQVIDKYLQDKYSVSAREVLAELQQETPSIPLSVFENDGLSSLELIARYLKDEKKQTYHEIASALNRDDRTIWCTYNNSLKKRAASLKVKESDIMIPLDIFRDRKYSVLESITLYLRDKAGLSFKAIAAALQKSYQTVYTSYTRGRCKDE